MKGLWTALCLTCIADVRGQPFVGEAAWPTPAHDNSNSGCSQFRVATSFSGAEVPPAVIWATPLVAGGKHGVVIDLEGAAYAFGGTGRLIKVDGEAGAVLWESAVEYGRVGGAPSVLGRSGDGTDSGPWSEEDTVYFGTEEGELIGLRAVDGTESLRFEGVRGPITTSVLIRNHIATNGTSAFFGAGSVLTAVDVRNASLRYEYEFGGGKVSLPTYGFCTIVASSSVDGGRLVNLNPHKFPGYGNTPGDKICRFLDNVKFDVSVPWGEVATVAVDTGFGGSGGLVVVASAQMGRVIGVDALTGDQRWNVQMPATVAVPVVSPRAEFVYVSGKDGVLRALRSRDGSLAWSIDVGAPIVARVAVDADGSVVVCAGTDLIFVSFFGEERWRYRGTVPITTPPVINAKGQVIYGDEEGLKCVSF